MVDTPTPPPAAKHPDPTPVATPRDSRLAAALRANLRRRKVVPKAPPREGD